jgi:hypothetical protein
MEHTLEISMTINVVLALTCTLLAISRSFYKYNYEKVLSLSKKYVKSHDTLTEIIALVKKHLE